MAYETGVANSPSDLLDKMRVFAAANGWTVNRWQNGNELCLQLGVQYVNVNAQDGNDLIVLYGSTGYDGGAAWNAQPGTSNSIHCNGMAGPYAAYHLFSDGANYIHCAAEVSAGLFRHVVFGGIEKTGAFTGGAYVDAVHWDGAPIYIDNPDDERHSVLFDNNALRDYFWGYGGGRLRADIDGLVDKWWAFDRNSTYRASGGIRSGGLLDWLSDRSPNTFNALTPLFPIYIHVKRPDAGSKWSILGTVRDLRFCDITHIDPGATLTIGSDDWMIFPIVQKNGGTDEPNSGTYGYAYRKVP